MHYILLFIDKYTDKIQLFIVNHIVLAPLLLLFLEEMGVPILVPGDAILGYVGFKLSQSHSATLWEAFILALIAVVCGSSVLYFISKRWGQAALTKISKYIFLPKRHLNKAETMFHKYGIWAIIFGRHIPGLRIPITIFAATSDVKYTTFVIGTIISTTLWILFYLSIGARYGSDILRTARAYIWITLTLVVLLAIVIVALHIRGRRIEKRKNS